jgi:mono/diheme cytochrome c family protein
MKKRRGRLSGNLKFAFCNLQFAIVFLLLVAGCRQKMADQPAYRPLQASPFFPDGRASRPDVPGTVARGQLRTDDAALYKGMDEKGEPVEEFPFEMTEAVLKRGRERFNIFCSVCHGLTGEGDGRIVQRGFTRPPAFYPVKGKDLDYLSRAYRLKKQELPLWKAAVGHYYDVITNGHGAMAAYAEQVPVRDRWAIVGYIRALQYSQSGEVRKAWQKEGKK